jgi:hypothetical protein
VLCLDLFSPTQDEGIKHEQTACSAYVIGNI